MRYFGNSPAFTEAEGRFEAVTSNVAAIGRRMGILVQTIVHHILYVNCYTTL